MLTEVERRILENQIAIMRHLGGIGSQSQKVPIAEAIAETVLLLEFEVSPESERDE